MPDRTFETLADGGGFFEGPRWHDGRWWVSDFYRHTVFAIAPDGATEEVMTVEAQPSGLGWLPDGSLLVVSMRDHKVLRRSPDGTVSVHADISEHCGGLANDIVVDTDGHAYVGNFGFDLMAGESPAAAVICHIAPDGTVDVAADDLRFPNGAVITPDGSTLMVGETMGSQYSAFSRAPDGALSDRRVWATVEGVAPDGCTLDAEGCIWAADALGNRLVRVAEGKGVVDEIPGPNGLGVYACMLGGEDGTTLLACAAPDYFEHNRAVAREAILATTTVDVPHAGLP
jgi:sugar lactone lactonase YvrE